MSTGGTQMHQATLVPTEKHEFENVEYARSNDIERSESFTDNNQHGSDGKDVPWSFTRVMAVISLCIAYVGSQIILYFVSSGLLSISISLETQLGNWMLTANTLAVTAICPFVGHFSDLLGRRWICITGTLCLVVASVLQATAKSLGQAVAGQAIGGIGAGICELTALAGVAEITPARWRGVTLAVVTFSIVPFMPQLLYTVLIVEHSTWRYCFLLTGLFNFLGMIGLFLFYRPPQRSTRKGLTAVEILKRIDWVGGFLSIAGVTLFLVGLQAGGYQYPWTSGHTLGPLIVGGLLLIAFTAWEMWAPIEHPMVPAQIFQGQRVVALAYITVFVAGMDFYSILGFFPIVLEYVYHTSSIMVGIRGLSYPWAILGGACIVSFLMSYTRGHVRIMFLLSAAVMTAFTGALAAGTPDNATYTVTMATFAALGNGALVVPALTLALFAAPDAYVGTVGALSLAVRFLGGSIGTSIYFNVFNTQLKQDLPAYVLKAAMSAGASEETAIGLVKAFATQVPTAPAMVPGVNDAILTAAQYASQWAYAHALRLVWFTSIPFGVISCICCAFLPNIREFMTNKVAVDLH